MATERAGKGDVSDKARNRGIAAVIAELSEETGQPIRLHLENGAVQVGVWQRDIDSIDWLHDVERRRWLRLTRVVGFEVAYPEQF